jgi:hypothetical protein
MGSSRAVEDPSPLPRDTERLVVAGRGRLEEALDPLEVRLLDLQRRHLAPVRQPDPPLAGHVVADLADGPDRVVERQVADDGLFLEHPQDQVAGGDLQPGRVLVHVRVADDHVQAPEPLGVGVGFVTGVDDRARPRRGRRHSLPDVLGPLRQREDRAPRGLQDLPGAGEHLPGHEERDQRVGERWNSPTRATR